MIKDKKGEKNAKYRILLPLVVLTILFLALSFIIAFANKKYGNMMDMFGTNVSTTTFSGVITTIQILVCVFIVLTDYKIGSKLACVLLSCSLIAVINQCVRTSSITMLPGILMSAGGIGVVLILYKQLSEINNKTQILEELSATDPLTGYLNRRGIEKAIQTSIDSNETFYLVFFDLDNFKSINDTMGHKIGDKVLCEIADRCSLIPGYDKCIARSGGDEFIIMVKVSEITQICDFMQTCLSTIGKLIIVDDFKYYATASLGACKFPDGGSDIDSLMKCADLAMYEAKRNGKNTFRVFTPTLSDQIQQNLNVENEVRHALRNDNFFFEYQPQYSAKDKRIRGFEALIRMRDSKDNVVMPADFIEIAENSTLIFEIDHWVLKNAMKQFKTISGKFNERYKLSINISAKHLHEVDFAEEVIGIIEYIGFNPELLELEITEYSFIKATSITSMNLRKLKAYGVTIALDDFGTGYASLSNLANIPIDVLKIDSTFIHDVIEDCKDDFLKSIIDIGHLFNCNIVSEGVEQANEVDILKKFDCDYIQGHIWSKPLNVTDLEAVMAEND